MPGSVVRRSASVAQLLECGTAVVQCAQQPVHIAAADSVALASIDHVRPLAHVDLAAMPFVTRLSRQAGLASAARTLELPS
ncbi:hypothetical protein CVO74_14610 [Xanthomonas prunicola]|uniref:Uncharacterized protein n=1 Tax=Xanthomonas prunicola TaxID=2053930 RepID=A0A2N3RIW1_9XANT|nr:hypothetical protein XpruCFBP8353_10905 [Xanthomonas prunicola]PKV16712.1 hypothetical protein XpruCFBP8354_10905 [Xanthomonas prunicola]PKV20873.1 hypothetical protein CVO74_14610 [Xanthomonas prunicola]